MITSSSYIVSSNDTFTISSVEKSVFLITKVKNRKKWTIEEDLTLIQLANFYKEKNWKKISSLLSNKTALQCFSRYRRIRPGLKKGHWNKEEDEAVLKLIKLYGKQWSKIAKIFKKRNGKQIRDRYINILDPNSRRNQFSKKEDEMLIKLYSEYGPKWALISKFFQNRTSDMIKNRFHSSIKKLFYIDGNYSVSKKTKNLLQIMNSNLKEGNEVFYNSRFSLINEAKKENS